MYPSAFKVNCFLNLNTLLNFIAKPLFTFLKYESTDLITPPFVSDIFTLDVLVEILETPLYFLSYLGRRVNYHSKLNASHELMVFAFHLKKNLWMEQENEFFYFTGDFGLIKEKVTEITDRIIRRTAGTTLADFFAVSVCPVSFGLLPFQY